MKIIYSRAFDRKYKRLSLTTKIKAEKAERIFRKDPFDSRLKTHKLKGKLTGYMSFSIDRRHRIIFRLKDSETAYFLTVGGHIIYR